MSNSNPTANREQVVNAVQVVASIADAIRELGSVPAGTLYAHLMGKFSIQQFDAIIAILVKAGLVSNISHQLRWTGPVV